MLSCILESKLDSLLNACVHVYDLMTYLLTQSFLVDKYSLNRLHTKFLHFDYNQIWYSYNQIQLISSWENRIQPATTFRSSTRNCDLKRPFITIPDQTKCPWVAVWWTKLRNRWYPVIFEANSMLPYLIFLFFLVLLNVDYSVSCIEWWSNFICQHFWKPSRVFLSIFILPLFHTVTLQAPTNHPKALSHKTLFPQHHLTTHHLKHR